MIQTGGRKILVLLFVTSLASLAFEIAILRLFSITLQHHFAFLVITVALLGIGAGGTVLLLVPALKDRRLVPWFSLFLGILMPAVSVLAGRIPFDPARLSWDSFQLLYAGLLAVVLALSFFCFGLIAVTTFSLMSTHSGRVYAADLTGAAAGALAALALLSCTGPQQAILCISLLPVLGAAAFGGGLLRACAAAAALLVLAGLLLRPGVFDPRISPYKPLAVALRYPGAEHLGAEYSPYARVDVFRSPAVRYAPGLSLAAPVQLPEQTGLAVDAGELHAVTLALDHRQLAFLDYLPSRLPYLLTEPRSVLVLDPRAGLPVLAAIRYGARSVSAVDSNGLVIRRVRKLTEGLPLPLYADQVSIGLRRTWLRTRTGRFDVIDVSLTAALPSAGPGFAEDHRLTVEAVRTYVDHLAPGGVLVFTLFLVPPPRAELRLLTTLIAAAEAAGLGDGRRHIAAIRSWGTITVMLKMSGISNRDILTLRRFCDAMRFDPVYYPGLREEEANRYVRTAHNEYFAAFRAILDPALRDAFLSDAPFDLRPVTDDRPFFHYYRGSCSSRRPWSCSSPSRRPRFQA